MTVCVVLLIIEMRVAGLDRGFKLLTASWPADNEQGDTAATFGLEGRMWRWLLVCKFFCYLKYCRTIQRLGFFYNHPTKKKQTTVCPIHDFYKA